MVELFHELPKIFPRMHMHVLWTAHLHKLVLIIYFSLGSKAAAFPALKMSHISIYIISCSKDESYNLCACICEIYLIMITAYKSY